MGVWVGGNRAYENIRETMALNSSLANPRSMPTLYDVPAEALIEAVAEELADRIDEPDWARFTKSGPNRELPPDQEDFWYVRAASVLRRIAIDGPVGISRLSTVYGGAADGSTRYRTSPVHHADGGRKILRTIVQQLDEAGLVSEQGSAGRQVTPDGRRLLDSVAGDVLASMAEDRPELERYV